MSAILWIPVILEWVSHALWGRRIDFREASLSLLAYLAVRAVGPVKHALILFCVVHIMPNPPLTLRPSIETWIALVIFGDFLHYLFHRADHSVRFMWAAHRIHHSFTQMTLLNSLRLPPMGLFRYVPTYLTLHAFGFPGSMILVFT